MRRSLSLIPAMAIALAAQTAVAQQQTQPTAGQPQAGSQMQDPVPLPDVPEAVAEELQESDVEGVDVPPGVGKPPQAGSSQVQNQDGASQSSGTASPDVTTTRPTDEDAAAADRPDVPVPDLADGTNLPPEAVDADRERYPGQPAYARQGDTELPIGLGNVIGKEVKAMDGESIGEVEDVLIDGQGASYVLVSLEGGRSVAIPWSQMSATRLNEEVLVSLPTAEINALPEFAENEPLVGQRTE